MSMSNSNTSKTFIKRIFGFSMASWVNCLISMVSTPITTALFPPEELGKINLFISYANILIPFVYLGFDQAYVRFYNEPCGKNTSNSIFKICLTISSAMAAVVGVAVLIGWEYFSREIIGYQSIIVALSLVAYLVGTMLLRYANLRARMENNIGLFFTQSVLSTFIIKLSFAGTALINAKPLYAIITRAALLFLAGSIWVFAALIKGKDAKVDCSKPVIVELGKYALPIFPTIFLVMLNTSLSQLMLNKYVDYSIIGIYSNAVTIAGIITIVQSGLNTFWTPFVYEYYKNEKMIHKMHHIVSFAMISMAFLITAFQDVIYLILVNKQYWGSKLIFAFLLISPISDTISETLGLGIELSKKTYLKLPVYVVNILVNLAACLLLIPKFSILGAAMANALASLSMLITKTIIGERYYKCSDNYYRLVIGIILLIANAYINYCFNMGIVKVISSIIFLAAIILLYKKSVAILIDKAKELLIRNGENNEKD